MVFLLLVVPPVLGEVPGGCDGPKGEDGLGGVQAPPGAGDIHSILDEVPAGPFDHPGGDRPASGQGGGVVQVGRLVGQVGRRLQSRFRWAVVSFESRTRVRIRSATSSARPWRIIRLRSWTQVRARVIPAVVSVQNNALAASQTYPATCR